MRPDTPVSFGAVAVMLTVLAFVAAGVVYKLVEALA